MAGFPGRIARAVVLAGALVLAGCGSPGHTDGVINASPDRDRNPVELTITDVRRVETTVELLGDATIESVPADRRGDYLVITFRFANPEDGYSWLHLGEFAVSWDDEWIWGEKSPATLADGVTELDAGDTAEYVYEFELQQGARVDEVAGPEDVLLYYKHEPGALWAESFDDAQDSADVVEPLSTFWDEPFREE